MVSASPKISRYSFDMDLRSPVATRQAFKHAFLRNPYNSPKGGAGAPTHAIPFFRESGIGIPFNANSLETRELTNLGMVWREMYLRLTGQLTCTAANNVAANMFPGDEWAVVESLTLRINGRDVYKRIDGASLRWLQYYLYGQFPLKSLAQLGDGATSNPSFDSTLILPFWMPKSSHPMDFAFDTSQVSRVDLEVVWRNYGIVNSQATGFTTPPFIQTNQYEVANVGGNFARWNLFPISRQFSGAETYAQVRIPVGFLYRSFLINDQSQILTRLRLQSHPNEWVNLPVQIIRDVIGNDRRNTVIPTAFANNLWLCGAPGDDIYHYYYFDNVGHGLNTESTDTFGLSEFYVNVDVNGAGLIVFYPSQLVVPRG